MQTETVEGYPLSPQQRHTWLLQQDDRSTPYRALCVVSIEGEIDKSELKAALDDAVDKNEILRTTFQCFPEMILPVQVITDSVASPANDYDLSRFAPLQQQAKLEPLIQDISQKPFDFENGPLLFNSIVTLSQNRHVLLICLPALCADAVTLKNLVRETCHRYAAIRDDGSLDDPVQYADLSQWQNELFEAEETKPGRKYWRSQSIASALALRFGFENQPEGQARFEPQTVKLSISASLAAKVQERAAEYETSTSVVLLLCWQILLWYHTRQQEITVGTICDGRKYEELERALGPFAKYLPVTCRVEARSKVAELLDAVKEATRKIHRWQECFSWDQILEPDDKPEAEPFFPFCFDFIERQVKYVAGPVSFSISRQYACADRFKVKLCFVESDDSLLAEFHFDSSLFNGEDITRLAAEFQVLLNSAVADPEARVSDLEVLSQSERRQLLHEFNNTQSYRGEERCIHKLFEAQVKQTPHKTAVVCEGQQLSYTELNNRANQLGFHLRSLGVKPEMRVAVCMDRSVEMIVAMLGILKAGGAYVPLDTDMPSERLAFILEDTAACFVLTKRQLVSQLPLHGISTICLDTDWAIVARNSAENLIDRAIAANLVYVIYTSGSTGKPKGVAVEHRQLFNYVKSVEAILELPVRANFATASSFAADLGNTVIFPSLCTGGCLYLISQERALDAEALADYFDHHAIDCLKIVPSHLAGLMASATSKHILPRRLLVLGGEASNWTLIDKIEAIGSDCNIINHYGPTEATIGVLTYRLAKAAPDRRSATLPLGRPISNAKIYLLDCDLKPVPIWACGEVYIGGACLSRGYLANPDLTADRFIPNPFSNVPGERLYRTGDLARYLPDGNIEFLGRADNQVKIRGHRIELEEIEGVLAQHSDVQEAVVLVHEEAASDKRLVAYLVTSRQPGPSISELRSFLKAKLPDYMLPSAFVSLKRLPLTANGKLDRKALAAISPALSNRQQYSPPRTETEAILAAIWQKVLGVAVVGLHDNYFSLGGDSIRVIQIAHEVRKYNLPMGAMDLFKNPTVYELARYISNGQSGESNNHIPFELIRLPDRISESLPDDVEDAYPISGMQQFIMHHYSNDPQKMGVYHIQHLTHFYDETLSVSALKKSLTVLIQKHASLRTVFLVGQVERRLQAVKKSVALSLIEDDLTNSDQTEQERYIEEALAEDRRDLFDITATDRPVFRFRLFLRSENSAELLMSMHHAISDGWGNAALESELLELYLSIKDGVEPSVACTPNVYKEFIALEQETVSSKQAMDFWNTHLINHAPMGLEKAEAALDDSSADDSSPTNEVLILDAGLAGELDSLTRRLGVSLKAICLSVYLDIVSTITSKNIVTVGVVSNGRTERLSDPLKALGLFWNIVPFCCRVEFIDRFEQIRAVQQLLIKIEPYATYPLSQILHTQHKADLFFATFNFLHFHHVRGVPAGSGLTILGSRGHDKFHFPLNYIVSVNPFNQELGLRVEYDRNYFSRESICSTINQYIGLLESLSAGG
jgi:amino acid adenylation domain-containing protein